MNTKNTKNKIELLGILLLSLLPYLINLNSFWLMDDATQIERGTQITWTRLFNDPYNQPEKFFRPLLIALSMMDGKIWGVNALGYRITNYLLFFFCGLLVYKLAGFFFSHRIALFSALIFLIHPIQVGTVVWLSGRVDILPAFFLLASAVVFLQDDKKPVPAVLWGSILFVLALLAKETALMFPAALFAGFIARGKDAKDSLVKVTPVLVIAALYITIRAAFNYLPGTHYYDPKKAFLDPVIMIRNCLAFVLNLIYIFVPVWNPFDVLKKDFPSAGSLPSLLFNRETAPVILFTVVGTSLIALFLWKGTSRSGSKKALLFFAAWFLAFVIPAFHVLGNMGGSRYFFTSCASAFCAIALISAELRAVISKKIFDSVIAAFLTLCLLMNVREQLAWRNAFDTAELMTVKVIKYARTIPSNSTLLVYDLPEYSPSGRLVYPRWEEYSLPLSVRLLSGMLVTASHSKPACDKEKLVCVSAAELMNTCK